MRTQKVTARAISSAYILLLPVALMLLSSLSVRAQTIKYTVVSLPGVEDGAKVAIALNRFGDVVGRVGGSLGSDTLAVLWSRDSHRPAHLSSLFAGEFSGAAAINDAGDVVGASNGPSALLPFIWQSTRGMQLLPLLRGDVSGEATSINRQGQVVGCSSGPKGTRAFIGTRGGVRELPGLSGAPVSHARRVNDAGQIVGYSVTPNGKRAVLWTPSGTVIDLGTLPGDSESDATGVNNAGEVVGCSKGRNGTSAFVWTKSGGMENVGVLPGASFSRALDINDAGTVVGTFSGSGSGGEHAFVWTRNGGIIDLNTTISPDVPVVMIEAHAINQRGQILASGMDTDSNPEGDHLCAPAPPAMFLLTPAVN